MLLGGKYIDLQNLGANRKKKDYGPNENRKINAAKRMALHKSYYLFRNREDVSANDIGPISHSKNLTTGCEENQTSFFYAKR